MHEILLFILCILGPIKLQKENRTHVDNDVFTTGETVLNLALDTNDKIYAGSYIFWQMILLSDTLRWFQMNYII